MRVAEQDWYGEWEIHTSCQEDKPKDWKPGDPIPYKAWGSATLRRTPGIDDRWISTTPLALTPVKFDDFNVAHRDVKAALISRIDALKKL